ncbi:MAG: DeoR/GlpR family DNA-binding transcription regulator [Luteolibacter sp.]
MLAIERHRKILEESKRNGAVRTQELSALLTVTEETIRRDLDTLARQGRLHRTHGGATDISMMLQELPQSEREKRFAEEKKAIGKLAVKYVLPNETLLLDASSTSLEFARQLPAGKGIRVVTYAMDIVEKLAMRNDIELVLLGGVFEPRGRRFTGMLTEVALRSLRIDRFFFSGGGFDKKLGVGEPNPEEARVKAAIIDQVKWKCAMIDHSKLGHAPDHFFVKPDELDVLISDSKGASYLKGLKGVLPTLEIAK